jgi:hypothetical protein
MVLDLARHWIKDDVHPPAAPDSLGWIVFGH